MSEEKTDLPEALQRLVIELEHGHPLEEDAKAAAVELRRLHALSVEHILIDINPGSDGMGHEVYAKSVKDVEDKLTDMGARLEDHELGIRKAAALSAAAPAAAPPELMRGWLRYEKARRLNPLQWASLHSRNLAGEFFDAMIDALPDPGVSVPVAAPKAPQEGASAAGSGFASDLDSALRMAEEFGSGNISTTVLRELWKRHAQPQAGAESYSPMPPTRGQIRDVFLQHGFTVKEGQTDLKEYVYSAAYALLALRALGAVPSGWVLVPVEPTDEMLNATYAGQHCSDVYRDMLAAAPAAPMSAQPSDADIDAAWMAYDWEGWTDVRAARRKFTREMLARWGGAQVWTLEMVAHMHRLADELPDIGGAPATAAPAAVDQGEAVNAERYLALRDAMLDPLESDLWRDVCKHAGLGGSPEEFDAALDVAIGAAKGQEGGDKP